MLLEELTVEIDNMESKDKALLLQYLANSISKQFPGIEKDYNILGGSACIAKTRIPIWTLEVCRRNSLSDAQILFDYPTLRAYDLVNAWMYVLLNKSEIEKDISENNE